MQRTPVIVLIIIAVIAGTSCGNVKNLQYLQGSFDTARLSKIQTPELLIQKGDLLGITVYSDDARGTAAVVNQTVPVDPTANSGRLTNVPAATGPSYLVSQDGTIQLYKLGVIHVEGMTKKRLADTLTQLYVRNELLKNPYIEVRYLNYKITLIGEVSRPGTYTIPTEKISAFEAIGLAGDITVYGKRNNVLVVREINGVRQFGQLDFSKPDVFLSPYYYLQQNDIVIVDVAKNKAAVNDQITVRNITVAASILSTIAIFINVFRR